MLFEEGWKEKSLGKVRKGLLHLGSALLLVVLAFGALGMEVKAGAIATLDSEYLGNNLRAASYFEGDGDRWSSPVTSYLSYDQGRLMRVQTGAYNVEGILVEYYDLKFQRQSVRTVSQELPLFGGFYAMGDYYYVVTGQKNPTESADIEVFRITKYDKEWNKVDSTGLYDCNTIEPFAFGSLRMAGNGKYLIIHTCHLMYAGSDGLNHQANATIQVDAERMKIVDSRTDVSYGTGYVSHSFNQFVKLDNDHIVTMDHGDAYPRSMRLVEHPTDVFTEELSNNCTNTDVLSFPGQIGANATGAAVGGLEISDSSYLVAGTSVVQDEDNLIRKTRNVYLAVVDKDTHEVTMRWLTDYDEGQPGVSLTHLIKVSDDLFMVLWMEGGKVRYVNVDGVGNTVGDIKELEGKLSNCAPIVVNEKVIWYTWDYSVVEFYRIKASDKYEGHVNTELQNFSYDENTHYLSGQIVVVEWIDVDGDGEKESTVPEFAPTMQFSTADGSEKIDVFVTPTGTNTYYFDRLIGEGLTLGKEYAFSVTSGNVNNVSEYRTVPVYTGTSGIGTEGMLGTVNSQQIRFKTSSGGTLLLYGVDPNMPYAGNINSLLTDVTCTVSDLGNFVSGNIIITEWIDGVSTVPVTTPIMTFESSDGNEINEVFMKCLDGTNTYYFDRNLSEELNPDKEYIFRITLTEKNNISELKSMVATTNEMSSKEGVLWETETQIVKYKTVPADGDNQLRIYAVNK